MQKDRSQSFTLRAGEDTAEIAYDRHGLAKRIRHTKATVFTGGGDSTWYVATRNLSLSAPIVSVVVRLTDMKVALNVRSISLLDATLARAYPLSADSPFRSDRRRFRVAAEAPGVTIFENRHARPAVWMVQRTIASQEPATDEEMASLRERLRGIDVARVAIVGDRSLANASWSMGSATPILVRPEHRTVLTTCRKSCLLLASETWTPSWGATIDGRPVPLVRADGVLQAVVVPGGHMLSSFVIGRTKSKRRASSALLVPFF